MVKSVARHIKSFDARLPRAAGRRKVSIKKSNIPTATRREISTVAHAIRALGGVQRVADTLRVHKFYVSEWLSRDFIPRGYELNVFLSLRALGYEPTPSLFGEKSWGGRMLGRAEGRAVA